MIISFDSCVHDYKSCLLLQQITLHASSKSIIQPQPPPHTITSLTVPELPVRAVTKLLLKTTTLPYSAANDIRRKSNKEFIVRLQAKIINPATSQTCQCHINDHDHVTHIDTSTKSTMSASDCRSTTTSTSQKIQHVPISIQLVSHYKLLLTIKYHYSLYTFFFALVDQDLAVILFFCACPLKKRKKLHSSLCNLNYLHFGLIYLH